MPDYNSKVVLSTGEVLMDLTEDTVTAANLLTGATAHGKDGAPITGACPYDADTSADTAYAAEILAGRTAHARGAPLEGTMTNNGAVAGTIAGKSETYTVPQGYHDGSGKVTIAAAQQAIIVPENIKNGVTILGVEGTYSGQSISVEANKNATPSLTGAVEVTPSTGFDYLAKVTVAQIRVDRAYDATSGGYIVTIG